MFAIPLDEGELSSSVGDEEEEESGGGNTKAPCRLLLPAGNGHPTVGVGLQSTGGRNESKDWRCGVNRMGCVNVSGVNMERNVDR